MPGEHCRIAGSFGELLQAAVHVVDVAAGEIGAAAALEEQRVTRDQPAVEQEALAAGRVAGRVQQLDLDVADVDLVAVLVCGEIAAGMPVICETQSASRLFTCTGTLCRSSSSARPLSSKPIIEPPTWSGWWWVTSTPDSFMPSDSRMSTRSLAAYAGSTTTVSPVSRSPIR